MEIKRASKAGTLESNDILIMVMPSDAPGVHLDLESIVLKQFGAQIRAVILETVEKLQVNNVSLRAQDKGALDYTIRARVETALKRASEEVSS